jgi:hypothetical protein
MEFQSKKPEVPVTEDAYADAAEDLRCDVSAIKAVAEVEARGAGFLDDGRPKILFERHKFRKYTRGRYNKDHPGVTGPPGTNKGGAGEYDRLQEALKLDREAALMSASWGKFQIMGFNHEACGFRDVEDFVEAMVESEDQQLEAFVGFVETNGLDRHLRSHNWARFARGYNGPQYRKNEYDRKMARAYEKYASEPQLAAPSAPAGEGSARGFRVETVRDLQTALAFLDISPGVIDNKMGPNTRAAIKKFQRFSHLPETGEFEVDVKAAVQAAYYLMKAFEALEKQAA